MNAIGILLGLTVAFFWGLADVQTNVAGRSIGTLHTTTLAQASGLGCIDLFFVLTTHSFPAVFPEGLLQQGITISFPLGTGPIIIMLGVLTVMGYALCYEGLRLGPIGMVSAIGSTNSAVTLALSLLFLREELSLSILVLLGLIIGGVLLTSVDLRSKGEQQLQGVPWAIGTAVCFGVLNFGTGMLSRSGDWLPLSLSIRVIAVCWLFLGEMVSWVYPQQTGDGQAVSTLSWKGVFFALGAGCAEAIGTLCFSLAVQSVSIGLVAVLASCYIFLPLLVGMVFYRDRILWYQKIGLSLIVIGTFSLTGRDSLSHLHF